MTPTGASNPQSHEYAQGLGAEPERFGELASFAPTVDRGAAQADVSGGFAGAQHLALRLACSGV